MSVINISGDKAPKLDRVSEHWPRTIQQYWRYQENRQKSLQAKLLSESLRLQSVPRSRKQIFAKRQSFVVPCHTVRA
tara:strand:+ start:1092 stop:1322 length:231 start_codon:yes stop_codon:yes gene_type:complete